MIQTSNKLDSPVRMPGRIKSCNKKLSIMRYLITQHTYWLQRCIEYEKWSAILKQTWNSPSVKEQVVWNIIPHSSSWLTYILWLNTKKVSNIRKHMLCFLKNTSYQLKLKIKKHTIYTKYCLQSVIIWEIQILYSNKQSLTTYNYNNSKSIKYCTTFIQRCYLHAVIAN